MSAQETTEKPARKRPGTKEKAEEQNAQVKASSVNDDALADPTLEEQIEVLVPYTDRKVWVIGRPPELGGTQGERDGFETYTQDKLGFIEMQQFFALCSRSLLKAVKEGGDNAVSELTGFIGGGTDIRSMQAQLRQQDFNEAANFMAMAFALVSYVPDFIVDSYALWLRVPVHHLIWFKETVAQPWDPDNDKYGLTRADGKEMVERFLDQNYEEIRSFFVEEIPSLINRVKQLEDQRRQKALDRGSDSQQSKQSST